MAPHPIVPPLSSTSSRVDGLSKEEFMPDMPTALAKQPQGAEHIAPDGMAGNSTQSTAGYRTCWSR